MSDFDLPSSSVDASEYFNVKDNIGSLVLFTPTEYREEVTTVFGNKDAVITDVVVLDGVENREYEGAMILQGALIGVLKKNAKAGNGRKVLGRIGQGVAKKGQAAPYILEVPSDADKKLATDYINKNEDPFAV